MTMRMARSVTDQMCGILTKDNLAKRNQIGDTTCCLCSKPEIIQHIFFERAYACFLWRVVHMVLGHSSSHNAQHLFNNWYPMTDKAFRSFFLIGAAEIC